MATYPTGHFSIYSGAKVAAEAKTVLVSYDYSAGRPVEVPSQLFVLTERIADATPSPAVATNVEVQMRLATVLARLAPDAVRLETPNAIVGVRGTTLAIRVQPE